MPVVTTWNVRVFRVTPLGGSFAPMARAGSLAPAAFAVLLVAGSACFLFNRGKSGQGAAASPEGEVALSVTNHNFLDVVIYVLHDGQQTRVGTVTGSSSQVFYLRARLLGMGREIRLLGHPIGGQDLARTETIVVQPGQYIEWTLETDLRRSSVGVY